MNKVDAGPTLRFAVGALAVWRVTHLLAAEDGPADAVARIRERLGDGLLGELADCFACLSVWTAAPAALLTARTRTEFVTHWLALSGAACLLERVGANEQPPALLLTEPRGDHDGLL